MDQVVAALVRRALDGDILTSAEIATQMDLASSADQIALHQLMHWISDEDIRQRDPDYAARQRKELANLLAETRTVR